MDQEFSKGDRSRGLGTKQNEANSEEKCVKLAYVYNFFTFSRTKFRI